MLELVRHEWFRNCFERPQKIYVEEEEKESELSVEDSHILTKWIRILAMSNIIWEKYRKFLQYWESCQSSATYDLWLKAETWSLNLKILI